MFVTPALGMERQLGDLRPVALPAQLTSQYCCVEIGEGVLGVFTASGYL